MWKLLDYQDSDSWPNYGIATRMIAMEYLNPDHVVATLVLLCLGLFWCHLKKSY